MPRKVAAVYRRDVARIQRAQILGIVPVVKMTAILGQETHGRACRFQPINGIERAGPSEIASTDGGQEIEAKVGGRGSMCQDGPRIFLEVIGRQHMVVRRNKGLEV